MGVSTVDVTGPAQASRARLFAQLLVLRSTLALTILAYDVLLARSLGPELKGVYQYLLEIPMTLYIFGMVGQHYVLNQEAHGRRDQTFPLFLTCITNSVLVSALLIAILLVAKPFTEQLLFHDLADIHLYVAWLFLLTLIPEVAFSHVGMLVTTVGKPDAWFLLRTIRRGIILVAAIVSLQLANDPNAAFVYLILGYALSAVVSALLGLRWADWRHQGWFQGAMRFIRRGLRVVPAELCEQRQLHLDVIFLGMIGYVELLGIFFVSFAINQIFIMFAQTVQSLLFSINTVAKSGVALPILRLQLPILFGMAPALGLAAQLVIIPYLYGDAFADAVIVTWLMLPASIFFSLITSMAPVLNQHSRNAAFSAISLLGLACRLLAYTLVVPSFGLAGVAAVASGVTGIVWLSLLWVLASAMGTGLHRLMIPERADFARLLKPS